MDGLTPLQSDYEVGPPSWLMTELTYKCPLQCPYCSNPVNFSKEKGELTTEQWKDVFTQARQLGVVQLGLSGGEPLVRQDLEELVKHAHELGFYINLITSSVGMTEERLIKMKENGLDNIQISFQASDSGSNDFFAGTQSYEHKVAMAQLFKKHGFPLIFNIVLHRFNIDKTEEILNLALSLGANYVELANTQYYGFALHNRQLLLPTEAQVRRSEMIAKQFKEKHGDKMTVYYVVPDYYEGRPKPCMNGWGKTFITITPSGFMLPCHAARTIPDLEFPKVTEATLDWIWNESPLFNRFRGYAWMKEPCRSCPERFKDFGGCRCQALLLTGDAAMADPVCDLSPDHHVVLAAVKEANDLAAPQKEELTFRNTRNSKLIDIPVRVEYTEKKANDKKE